MPKYVVEVVISGRVNVEVHAQNEADAEKLALNHPDVPDFDKVYDSDSNVIQELE